MAIHAGGSIAAAKQIIITSQLAMASKDGPHLQASFPCGSSCTMWPVAKEKKKRPAAGARKPKRTSFACLECSKTFPTQQAMAGHCSAHTRAGAGAGARTRNHLPAAAAPVAAPSNPLPQVRHYPNAIQCWCPQVQVSPARTIPIPMPPLAVRYARPTSCSNQMMVRLPYPYPDPRGRRSSRTTLGTIRPRTNPAFFRPAGPMPPHVPASGGQLGWRAFVPIYGVPPTFSMNGAAPPSDAASSTDRPRADLALRLGSGREHRRRKRTLPLLESLVVSSDGHQHRKCKLVSRDGGDQDRNQMGGLDLELRLYR